jgi:hypothetical protein
MSRPRFLADNDLNDAIVRGTLRREPVGQLVSTSAGHSAGLGVGWALPTRPTIPIAPAAA